MVLQKPQMRGLLTKQIKVNVPIALAVSLTGAVCLKVFYNDPLKQKYADFYKTYNAEESFERMRKKGLFQSCE